MVAKPFPGMGDDASSDSPGRGERLEMRESMVRLDPQPSAAAGTLRVVLISACELGDQPFGLASPAAAADATTGDVRREDVFREVCEAWHCCAEPRQPGTARRG